MSNNENAPVKIKKVRLPKGHAKFIMGIDSVAQLESWIKEYKNIIGIAFVGRSNVGKSSTINALFGKATARTSNTPGRTRQVNIFIFELTGTDEDPNEKTTFFMFDLPGYGHAKVSKEMSKNWVQLMNSFFKNLSESVAVINIQDSRHPNQKADKEFHKYLKTFDNETFLVLNKSDKLRKQSERAVLQKMLPALLKEYKWVKKFFIASAVKGESIEQIHDTIVSFLLQKEIQLDLAYAQAFQDEQDNTRD
ncbi:MAG: GTP-binding protein [Thermoproteota archaeon]|jgi:GTP-binding protein